MSFRFRIAAGLCTLSIVSFAVPTSLAQSAPSVRVNQQNNTPVAQDFLVSPPRALLTLNPGESRAVEVQITNRFGEPKAFGLSTEDFDIDPESQTPRFYGNRQKGPYSARDWLQPEAEQLSLRHGDRAFLRVTVTAPEGATPGDHQAALIVQTLGDSQSPSGINVTSRVAALFIITVPGKIEQAGGIDRLSVRHFFNWESAADLSLDASNTGNVYMSPEGSVLVRNLFGVVIDELPVKDWVVLRASGRRLDLPWRPSFALGRYTAETQLTIFGKRAETVSTSFWVLPILPLLILLLAVLLVSFVIQYVFGRYELRRKS